MNKFIILAEKYGGDVLGAISGIIGVAVASKVIDPAHLQWYVFVAGACQVIQGRIRAP